MSTGRLASFDGLVINLISAKDGRTFLSSGGSLVEFNVILWLVAVFATFFEDDGS